MKGDFHVRFCENLRVKLPWVTRLVEYFEKKLRTTLSLSYNNTCSNGVNINKIINVHLNGSFEDNKMDFQILTDYKENKFSHKYESKDKRTQIVFGQIDEPNYGRLLRKFELIHNSQIVTEKYFNKWNYTQLIKSVDFGFQFTDQADKYCFIPHESKPQVLAKNDLEVILHFKNENLIHSNYFTQNDFLIIETDKTIEVINLITRFHEIIDRKKLGEAWIKATNKIDSTLVLLTNRKVIYVSLETKKVLDWRELVKPSTIFGSDLYTEYERLTNDEDRGYIYAIGSRSIDKQILDLSVNDWEIFEYDRMNNTLILGTLVPTELEKRDYTYWFKGQNQYIKIQI